MEILVWIMVGFLVSGQVYYFLYRRKLAERERRLKDFILDDQRFRQLYLDSMNQDAKRTSP